jgi:hypothetical protein
MNRDRQEVIDEVSMWAVGLGILTFALAPLALPGILLTLVFVAPLLLLGLAAALVVGVPVAIGLGIRALARRIQGRPRPERREDQRRPVTSHVPVSSSK